VALFDRAAENSNGVRYRHDLDAEKIRPSLRRLLEACLKLSDSSKLNDGSKLSDSSKMSDNSKMSASSKLNDGSKPEWWFKTNSIT
jgi:hypothetical protein